MRRLLFAASERSSELLGRHINLLHLAAAVVHCGACAITRGQMLARLDEAPAHGLPMTNYGMCISLAQGVLERVLSPFPEALAAWRAQAQLPG